MFQFRVAADGPEPVVVRFEPLAWEVVISSGDYILIEWPESVAAPEMAGTFCSAPGRLTCSAPGRLTILEPNFLPGPRNYARMWNSAGVEITY